MRLDTLAAATAALVGAGVVVCGLGALVFRNAIEHPARLLGALSSAPTVDSKFEWTSENTVLLAITTICALLANACGIGGGPFYVALFNSVLGFDLVVTTALSHTIVTCSTIASTLYGLTMQHPEVPGYCLIDFDIALTFMPSMLFGVGCGVLVNVLLPEWLKLVVLVVIYVHVTQKTFKKAFKSWRTENEKLAAQQGDGLTAALLGLGHERKVSGVPDPAAPAFSSAPVTPPSASPDEELLIGPGDLVPVARAESALSLRESVLSNRLSRGRSKSRTEFNIEDLDEVVLQHEDDDPGAKASTVVSRLAWVKVIEAVALWVVFLALQMLKSQHPHCTWGYAVLWAIQAAVSIAWTVVSVSQKVWQVDEAPQDLSPELQMMLLDDDPDRPGANPTRTLWAVVGLMFSGGVLAGATGIGGALIFSPYLLALGMHPQVVASTAVFIIFFSSSSIATSFYFQGLLNTSYATVFDVAGFLASFAGVILVGRLVRASGRPSLIVFILAAMIALSAVLTMVSGVRSSITSFTTGEGLWGLPFCSG